MNRIESYPGEKNECKKEKAEGRKEKKKECTNTVKNCVVICV
jgi:hypothetical protein